jgi:uncharacterized protein YbcI
VGVVQLKLLAEIIELLLVGEELLELFSFVYASHHFLIIMVAVLDADVELNLEL